MSIAQLLLPNVVCTTFWLRLAVTVEVGGIVVGVVIAGVGLVIGVAAVGIVVVGAGVEAGLALYVCVYHKVFAKTSIAIIITTIVIAFINF
jgi:hypothetical protein